MVVLAFDFGKKKTGVAIGNTITHGARPLATVRGNRPHQRAQIDEIIRQWQPAQLVVGLPCHMDGTPHTLTRWCHRQGEHLAATYTLPCAYQDERLTTALAKDAGDVVRPADERAAAIILQAWLDAHQAAANQ